MAGAGSIAALALFAPASAMAHPCASANANVASSFLSVNNAMWAGMRPVEVGHDCSSEGGPVTAAMKMRGVAGDPLGDAVNPSTFDWSSNMTPLGYAAERDPVPARPYNSDLAFQGNYAYQGTNNGFVVIDISNPADPKQVHLNTAARPRRVTSWSTRTSSSAHGFAGVGEWCGYAVVRRQLAGQGFEGVHIFDISDPTNPKRFVRGLRFSALDTPRGLRLAHGDRRCRTRRAATSTSTTAARAASARGWTS